MLLRFKILPKCVVLNSLQFHKHFGIEMGGKYGITRGTFFQGIENSGPHCRSGHYLTLEKLPSGNPVLTT